MAGAAPSRVSAPASSAIVDRRVIRGSFDGGVRIVAAPSALRSQRAAQARRGKHHERGCRGERRAKTAGDMTGDPICHIRREVVSPRSRRCLRPTPERLEVVAGRTSWPGLLPPTRPTSGMAARERRARHQGGPGLSSGAAPSPPHTTVIADHLGGAAAAAQPEAMIAAMRGITTVSARARLASSGRKPAEATTGRHADDDVDVLGRARFRRSAIGPVNTTSSTRSPSALRTSSRKRDAHLRGPPRGAARAGARRDAAHAGVAEADSVDDGEHLVHPRVGAGEIDRRRVHRLDREAADPALRGRPDRRQLVDRAESARRDRRRPRGGDAARGPTEGPAGEAGRLGPAESCRVRGSPCTSPCSNDTAWLEASWRGPGRQAGAALGGTQPTYGRAPVLTTPFACDDSAMHVAAKPHKDRSIAELTRAVFGEALSVDDALTLVMEDLPAPVPSAIATVWVGSVGYERYEQNGEFACRLLEAGVQRLVDVRELPISRRRGYAERALSEAMAEVGHRVRPCCGTRKPEALSATSAGLVAQEERINELCSGVCCRSQRGALEELWRACGTSALPWMS